MKLRTGLFLIVALAVVGPASAGSLPDGNWKVTYYPGPTGFTYMLVKTETKDGKLSAQLLPSGRFKDNLTLDAATLEKDQLRLAFKGPAEFVFQAAAPKDATKTVRGTMQLSGRTYPAELTATDATELTTQDNSRPLSVPAMQKAAALNSRPLTLRLQAQRETDAEKKAQLLKDAAAATEEAKTELPKLYREVLDKHADSPAVFNAGLELLKAAGKDKTPAADVRTWAAAMTKAAEAYGTNWQRDVVIQVAEALASQDGMEALAIEYGQLASSKLDKDAPFADQLRVYKPLANALKKAGKLTEAKAAEDVVAKLDAELDKEYKAKVPPFKPETFAGRKGDSNRAVVMELFTGAQCPPCVAADVAFDALEMAYKPKDLVLIQYHLHIPGPDPLTNAETVARAAYYGVRSTPSTFFNGKADAAGGGGMANAQKKFDQYTGIINPLLDQPAGAQVRVNAVRQGSKVIANVDVTGVAEPAEDMKLRVLLVEETIRYVGGNNLRFHHQVVRGFLGGPDGVAIKEKDTKQTVEIDLKDLSKQIQAYLDEYNKQRPFPNMDRPLHLKNLRVIAFVQNDKTKEILQGVQVELADETASK